MSLRGKAFCSASPPPSFQKHPLQGSPPFSPKPPKRKHPARLSVSVARLACFVRLCILIVDRYGSYKISSLISAAGGFPGPQLMPHRCSQCSTSVAGPALPTTAEPANTAQGELRCHQLPNRWGVCITPHILKKILKISHFSMKPAG